MKLALDCLKLNVEDFDEAKARYRSGLEAYKEWMLENPHIENNFFLNEMRKSLSVANDLNQIFLEIENTFMRYAVIRFLASAFLSAQDASEFTFETFSEIVASTTRNFDHNSEVCEKIKMIIKNETGDKQAAIALIIS